MTTVLVIPEARRGELRDVSLELVGAARRLAGTDGRVVVAAIDSEPDGVADALDVAGVDELLTVPIATEHFEAHAQQAAVAALIDEVQPEVVLCPFSVDAMGWAPALAAKLGLGFASDVTAADSNGAGPEVRRTFYGGKVELELEFPGKGCTLLMLRPGAFEPAEGAGGAARRAIEVQAPPVRTEHLGFEEVEAGDVDITAAEFLLSIGRGVEDGDNIEQFAELASRLGATLSVSRPLVDAGWMPSARQVGQSGRTVKPKVYLAMGISGAVQHLAGIRDAETIIAVNTDPEAPIFGVAHYGAVADMFEVAKELADRAP